MVRSIQKLILEEREFTRIRTGLGVSVVADSILSVIQADCFQDFLNSLYSGATFSGVQVSVAERALGREAPRLVSFSDGINGILRFYRRGGLVGKIQRRYFLRRMFSAECELRPIAELIVLQYLAAQGVSVLTPLLANVRFLPGRFLYQGLLLTERYQNVENLLLLGQAAVVDRSKQGAFQAACYRTGKEASRAVMVGVQHGDLHLGNVLVGGDGKVVLIDFDKSKWLKDEEQISLAKDELSQRWARSCKRVGLSELARQPFCEGLYERSEESVQNVSTV